jgi:excisionase family DNA binding protein
MFREFRGNMLTVEDVASYLGVSLATIYRLTQKGKIPAQKVGGQWRYLKEEIDRWMKERR